MKESHASISIPSGVIMHWLWDNCQLCQKKRFVFDLIITDLLHFFPILAFKEVIDIALRRARVEMTWRRTQMMRLMTSWTGWSPSDPIFGPPFPDQIFLTAIYRQIWTVAMRMLKQILQIKLLYQSYTPTSHLISFGRSIPVNLTHTGLVNSQWRQKVSSFHQLFHYRDPSPHKESEE